MTVSRTLLLLVNGFVRIDRKCDTCKVKNTFYSNIFSLILKKNIQDYTRFYFKKKLTIQATLIYINCHTCHINRSSKLYPARNAFHIDKCVVPIFVLAPERRNVVTYKTRQERPKVAKELNWKVWKIWKLSVGRMDIIKC